MNHTVNNDVVRKKQFATIFESKFLIIHLIKPKLPRLLRHNVNIYISVKMLLGRTIMSFIYERGMRRQI